MKAAVNLSKLNNHVGHELVKAVLPDGREAVTDYETTLFYPAGSLPSLPEYGQYSLPETPELDAPEVDLPADFAKTLTWVSKAAAKGDPRYMLNGVLFDGSAGKIVATDGSRIHVADCPEIQGEAKAVLPNGAIKTLLQLIKDCGKGARVSVKLSERFVWFFVNDVAMHVKSIDWRYPDWQLVMPESLTEYRELPIDICALAKKHAPDARMVIERENAQARAIAAHAGTKPKVRRVSDSTIVIRRADHSSVIGLEDGTGLEEIAHTFDKDFAILIKYAVDAALKASEQLTDSDRLYLMTDTCKAVVMARRA